MHFRHTTPSSKMETSPEVLESSSKKYAMHISKSNFEYLMPYQPGFKNFYA